jgi:hypothetical protein
MATTVAGIIGNGDIAVTIMDGIIGLEHGDTRASILGRIMGPGAWHSTTTMSLMAGGKPVR